MQVGWPSGDTEEPAAGSMWPRSPSSWALSSFTRWWFGFSFQPQTSFPSPASHPPPGCGDRNTIVSTSAPPTTLQQEGGSLTAPTPASLEPRRECGPSLLGCLRSSNRALTS